MKFENREIKIVFENCEILNVITSGEFDITTTKDDCVADIDNVKLTIPKSSNGIYTYPWQDGSETTTYNRLANSDNITQIVIDGNTYYPKWYEENEYAWSQNNKYQCTYKTEDGSVVIDISTSNKQILDALTILDTLSDFMEENPTMSFGKIVHAIECKLGSSVINARNKTVITMLEELMMEAI